MFYWLICFLIKKKYHYILYLSKFLILRSILSGITAFLICLFFGNLIIKYLKQFNIRQILRCSKHSNNLLKKDTPTMGGILIIFSICFSCLIWGDLCQFNLWIAIFVIICFGIVGAVDDYLKLACKNKNGGLSVSCKYFFESLIVIGALICLYFNSCNNIQTQLIIPLFNGICIDVGPIFLLLDYIVVMGSSNAVNLTDGLDGLVIFPIITNIGFLCLLIYMFSGIGNIYYCNIPVFFNIKELIVFCFSIIGSVLGFLWYNCYPAQIFMGDTGSLAIGSALGIISVIGRQEFFLMITGGIFILETMSVIFQVLYFKYTKGRRLFNMTPLHHHFELKGLHESKIIVRFWIINMLFTFIGLFVLIISLI
ncbi:phospho-N-acetylmuramoyl-pentapeptide-transferase [Candidatus Legionella polyplacis]|uniref:Phospho-N-acetylmuramoyl-pentapeptide-transferase n=1 Tax=Candidatus Legionella polyplacis TaxID=2005262 RepID=A0ABZ2H0T0_9GAMM